MKGVDRRKKEKRKLIGYLNLSGDALLKKNVKYFGEKILSEVGFEPTPTEVDCDLNAAP